LGCIIFELITGKPLFPAKDENELLEYFTCILGEIPEHMVLSAKKYSQFFKKETSFLGYVSHQLIRSKESYFIKKRISLKPKS